MKKSLSIRRRRRRLFPSCLLGWRTSRMPTLRRLQRTTHHAVKLLHQRIRCSCLRGKRTRHWIPARQHKLRPAPLTILRELMPLLRTKPRNLVLCPRGWKTRAWILVLVRTLPILQRTTRLVRMRAIKLRLVVVAWRSRSRSEARAVLSWQAEDRAQTLMKARSFLALLLHEEPQHSRKIRMSSLDGKSQLIL